MGGRNAVAECAGSNAVVDADAADAVGCDYDAAEMAAERQVGTCSSQKENCHVSTISG